MAYNHFLSLTYVINNFYLGGELKRLSFACEILVNPMILLCDEPTSGLDSFMAQSVVQIMKNLAQNGHTVICTIHQPSSQVFHLFDDILLMSEGKTVFIGKKTMAENFFQK